MKNDNGMKASMIRKAMPVAATKKMAQPSKKTGKSMPAARRNKGKGLKGC